jgi:hypothetical protein
VPPGVPGHKVPVGIGATLADGGAPQAPFEVAVLRGDIKIVVDWDKATVELTALEDGPIGLLVANDNKFTVELVVLGIIEYEAAGRPMVTDTGEVVTLWPSTDELGRLVELVSPTETGGNVFESGE